eukprot:11474732-Alexandrium_andersonii.AAC.1
MQWFCRWRWCECVDALNAPKKSEGRRRISAVKLSPWPAGVLHPARPKCSSQRPASERPPERAQKRKEPAAMNLPVALK